MQKCLHPALFAFNNLNIKALRSVCTLALCLHFTCTAPTQYLHYTCTYITATYHNIGRWKELSEQPNILPPHTQTPPWHNRKHSYAWVCKLLCRQVCTQKRLLPTRTKALATNALRQKVQGAGKITKQIFRAVHLHFVHL